MSLKVYVDFARHLARRGFHVLRFDYRGDGDSEGSFEEATLETRIADIRQAISLMRERGIGRVGLLGLRVGGTLATMVATSDPLIHSLLLWEPVVDLRDYVGRFLRTQVTAENGRAGRLLVTRADLVERLKNGNTVDVLGSPLSTRCYRQFCELNALEGARKPHGPTLIVAIGGGTEQRQDLKTMLEACRLGHERVDFVRVNERRFWHDPNDPWREVEFWHGHEELFRLSSEWLDSVDDNSPSRGRFID